MHINKENIGLKVIQVKVSTHTATKGQHTRKYQSPEEFTRRDWSQGLVPRTVDTERFVEQVGGTLT